jgi:hypothetical protein
MYYEFDIPKDRPPESLVGGTSIDVIEWLVERYDLIRTLWVGAYTPRPHSPADIKERIRTKHLEGGGRGWEISREEVLAGELRRIAESLPPERALVVNSKVKIEAQREEEMPSLDGWLIFGDFDCQKTEENEQMLVEAMTVINLPGWLIDSGEHWHVVGEPFIFRSRAQYDFVGAKLGLTNLADERYEFHNFARGYGSVRLSPFEVVHHSPWGPDFPSEPELRELLLDPNYFFTPENELGLAFRARPEPEVIRYVPPRKQRWGIDFNY